MEQDMALSKSNHKVLVTVWKSSGCQPILHVAITSRTSFKMLYMYTRPMTRLTFIKEIIPLLGPGGQHGRVLLLDLAATLDELAEVVAELVAVVTAFDGAQVLAHLPETVAAGLQHVIVDGHDRAVVGVRGLEDAAGCRGPQGLAARLSLTSLTWPLNLPTQGAATRIIVCAPKYNARERATHSLCTTNTMGPDHRHTDSLGPDHRQPGT